ncbi:A24 family peptidase [Lacunimicrobium album]
MDWNYLLFDHWEVKLVTIFMIWAAWIDGRQLRVPNWMTYPMILAGLVYNSFAFGWDGAQMAFVGMIVGLLTLLPLYAVGGMGAGDVKMMAAIGAWLGAIVTWYAFCASVIVGAIMAIIMVLWRRDLEKHTVNAMIILNEWSTIRDPNKLAAIAKERKPRMLLLPYGIPICIGSIGYFMYTGMYW